jgi:endoribonuclease LACTB2
VRTIRYRQTSYFAIEANGQRFLALDAGRPCSLFEYARHLKAVGVTLDRIAWAIVTHFHPDHAGLVGEFQARGIECLAFEDQGAGIPEMEAIIERSWRGYRAIDEGRLQRMHTRDSRAWLAQRGIGGQVLPTPGHSDDSVSFVSDSGDAVIGDLTLPDLVMPDDGTARASWAALASAGVRRVYPSHAPPFDWTAR